MTWIVFVLLILIIVGLIIAIFKTSNSFILIPLIVVILFFAYSYFTVDGSLKLAVALYGYPIEGYKNDYREDESMNKNNERYFLPINEIETKAGTLRYIQMKEYNILKISKYYG